MTVLLVAAGGVAGVLARYGLGVLVEVGERTVSPWWRAPSARWRS